MRFFDAPEFDGHEEVAFVTDREVGLWAILAIHDTRLGPALGGCRMLPYRSSEEALRDVLRLSRAMTYKAACAGVPFGGGKCVVIGDPHVDKRPELLGALGKRLARFDGRFFLGEDVGTSTEDMAAIHAEAPNVVGLPIELGGSGDPSAWTALGCVAGLRTTVKEAFGLDSVSGLKVAVQGIGNVGWRLCDALVRHGATLVITDVRTQVAREAAEMFGATLVAPPDIYDADADVFAPCALGGVLSGATVDRLKARVVAGCANNQLEDQRVDSKLNDRGILYAPDYVINAGGMIRLAAEIRKWNDERLDATIDNIAMTLAQVFEVARTYRIPTGQAADRIARERLHVERDAR
jgi:leucine dehydrogenase